MIKYYAYYNHGGYKDFYLGNREDVEDKYFLPLLAIHEASLADTPDDELLEKVTRQRALPKLLQLSDATAEYNYPKEARVMMSHAGYKVLYRQIGSCTMLAIRDIAGAQDTYGRKTPFNVMLVGDTSDDIKSMDAVAEFIRLNLSDFEQTLKNVFVNDLVEGGLKCHLGLLNSAITEIINSGITYKVDERLHKSVRLLVIPQGGNISNALQEQSILKSSLLAIYDTTGACMYKAPPAVEAAPTKPTTGSRTTTSARSTSRQEHGTPSLHAMLNVPKQDDIDRLWTYVKALEKRIIELENIMQQ